MLRTIILPAYNEEGFIVEMINLTIKACESRSDPFEIIIIDNASSDNTAKVIKKAFDNDSRVRLISHKENRLYAGSCLTGVRGARGDRIFIMDSDGQHSPADIWRFDSKLDDGYDVVFGWRQRRVEPPFRILMSKTLLMLTRFYVGYSLHDVNCGIRGFTRAFADKLDIKFRVNLVNPELYVRARLGGFQVGEIPVVQASRKSGVSSHDFKRLWKIFGSTTSYLSSLGKEIKSGE